MSITQSYHCQRRLPVLASSATRWPSSPPVTTTPPAVDTVPDQMPPKPVIGYSHARLPVFGSLALRITCPPSSVAAPLGNFFIGTDHPGSPIVAPSVCGS